MARRRKNDTYLLYLAGLFIALVIIKNYPWIVLLAALMGIIAFTIWILDKAKSRKFKPYDISFIDSMDPFKFEEYICNLYKNLGYKYSYVTQGAGDFGADVVVEHDLGRRVIQVKKYKPTNKVGVKALYEVLGGKEYYKAQNASVITTSYFTESAYKLAKSANIELIDRPKLISLIQKTSV